MKLQHLPKNCHCYRKYLTPTPEIILTPLKFLNPPHKKISQPSPPKISLLPPPPPPKISKPSPQKISQSPPPPRKFLNPPENFSTPHENFSTPPKNFSIPPENISTPLQKYQPQKTENFGGGGCLNPPPLKYALEGAYVSFRKF